MKNDLLLREYEESVARAKHNNVDTRERCDRCGKILLPKDMLVGDFEQYHTWCDRSASCTNE